MILFVLYCCSLFLLLSDSITYLLFILFNISYINLVSLKYILNFITKLNIQCFLFILCYKDDHFVVHITFYYFCFFIQKDYLKLIVILQSFCKIKFIKLYFNSFILFNFANCNLFYFHLIKYINSSVVIQSRMFYNQYAYVYYHNHKKRRTAIFDSSFLVTLRTDL